MAYDFKRLSDVEMLNEVPEGATVLAEVNGSIKRVPGAGLGGGGIKTAIIKDSDYDNIINLLTNSVDQAKVADAEPVTYECINMTFEEAYDTLANGEPLEFLLMMSGEGAMNVRSNLTAFMGTRLGVPCIGTMFDFASLMLYWTADGLSTEMPSSGE